VVWFTTPKQLVGNPTKKRGVKFERPEKKNFSLGGPPPPGGVGGGEEEFCVNYFFGGPKTKKRDGGVKRGVTSTKKNKNNLGFF